MRPVGLLADMFCPRLFLNGQSASAPEMISMSSLVIIALPRAVIERRLLADHVAGIARRAIHSAHARALFRGSILKQSAKNLHGDISRQQS